MDNLARRKLFAYIGIAFATVGIVVMGYGLLTGNVPAQLLGLAGVFIAYVLSVIVRNLRKAAEKKG